MIRARPAVPKLGAAVVGAFSVALRGLAVVQWELGAAPSVASDFAPRHQVHRTIVDTGVAVTVLLASPAPAVLQTGKSSVENHSTSLSNNYGPQCALWVEL